MSKALAEGTGASGGYLVPVELSGEIAGLIRARSAVMRLGPRLVPVKKELDVSSIAAGATAYYVAENANIPTSEQTFAQRALLKPKDLAALVPVSLRLVRDAAQNPDVESILRTDIAEVLALRQDLAFLQGLGNTASDPITGIINTPGLTPGPSLGTGGRPPTFDDLLDMLAALRDANAPFAQPGWIFNPRTLTTLEKLKTTTGEYLADAGLLTYDPTGGGGTLLGFKFATSTQIPKNLTVGANSDASYIILGSDWNEAWVGVNEVLTIEFSDQATYTPDGGTTWVSAFQARQRVFRAVTAHDFALRRPTLSPC